MEMMAPRVQCPQPQRETRREKDEPLVGCDGNVTRRDATRSGDVMARRDLCFGRDSIE